MHASDHKLVVDGKIGVQISVRDGLCISVISDGEEIMSLHTEADDIVLDVIASIVNTEKGLRWVADTDTHTALIYM